MAIAGLDKMINNYARRQKSCDIGNKIFEDIENKEKRESKRKRI